jgi:microcystin-dependent protein
MAINFPTPTVLNQEFTDPSSNNTYIWSGTISPLNGFWIIKSADSSNGTPTPGGGNASIYVGPIPPVTPGENQLWWNTNSGRMYLYYDDGDTIQWVETSPGTTEKSSVPVGTIIQKASLNVPAGYMICDGRLLDRTVYSALFADIGTIWGEGNGVTTFNIPDLRASFLRGLDLGKGLDVVGSGNYSGTLTSGSGFITKLSLSLLPLLDIGMKVTSPSNILQANTFITSITTEVIVGVTYVKVGINTLPSGSTNTTFNFFGRKLGTKEDAMILSHQHTLPENPNNQAIGTSTDSGEGLTGYSGASKTDFTGGPENRPANDAVVYMIKVFDDFINPALLNVSTLSTNLNTLQNNIKKFTSPAVTASANASNVIPHNLATMPDHISYYLRNISGSSKGGVPNNGIIEIYPDQNVTSGFTALVTNADVTLRFANNGSNIIYTIKDMNTSSSYSCIGTDWELFIKTTVINL